MTRKFWAKIRSKQVGPFATREDAERAFVAKFGLGKPSDRILTGYGEFGAHGDIRWIAPRDVAPAESPEA